MIIWQFGYLLQSEKMTGMRAKYKYKCHFHTYLQKQYLFTEKYSFIQQAYCKGKKLNENQ